MSHGCHNYIGTIVTSRPQGIVSGQSRAGRDRLGLERELLEGMGRPQATAGGVEVDPGMDAVTGVTERDDLVGLTAEIVSAYVSNNQVQVGELPGLIGEIHQALSRAAGGTAPETTERDDLRPAVPIKKSVTDEYIICLEDGKKFKSLKRHLRTHYKLSPDQYRAKWNLPPSYPMVAPNYAAARSQLAKRMGLGTSRREK